MSRVFRIQTFNQTMDFPNLRELLEARAGATPEKVFLFSEADGRRFTYREFDAAVNRTARLLHEQGVRRSDVVSLLLPNSAEYVIAYFACFKLGAIAGPVNSLLKPEEMAYVVGNSEASFLLFSRQFAEQVWQLRREVHTLGSVQDFDDEAAVTSGLDGTADGAWLDSNLTRDDEAIIIYTSGTTGKPKGCLLTHGNLLANARQIVEWLGFTERRPAPDGHAALSHERRLGDDRERALRGRLDGDEPELLRLAPLADH